MKAKNSPLTEIGLQNFQVFGPYTSIPLAPLTLIYGPNSAGKSAIFDAIDIAAAVWGQKKHEDFLSEKGIGFKTMLEHSYFRRLKDNVLADGDSAIDVELVGSQFGSNSNCKIKGELRFCHDEEDGILLRGYRILQGDDPICRSDINGHAVNLRHKSLQHNKYVSKALLQLEEMSKYPLEFDGSWVTLSSGITNHGTNFRLAPSQYVFGGINGTELRPDEVKRAEEFADIYNRIASTLAMEISNALSFSHVGPSRTVPKQNELNYLITSSDKIEELLGFKTNGLPQYFSLAHECLQIALAESFPQILLPELTENLQGVNEILSGHLFLDRAYQITANVHFILTPKQIANLSRMNADENEDYAALVQLKLLDAEGRLFNFTEVGSGLGYILPILMDCMSGHHSFIEQPELHLHPALQSALGDVFIEIINRHQKTLLIETHSEYLLLRILKRIRQTDSKKTLDSLLKLTNEKLCVLYLNPTIDGTTSVKRLRVTADGDFMDRWPRGFFEERDQELFDE